MNKQEFVDRLRMALNGRVSPGLVMDNVNYYQDYINTEIRKGRTEEEVLESLGDPRLIARTIIQTNGGDNRSVLSFLAPVLIPIVVVLFLVKLFRDWLN